MPRYRQLWLLASAYIAVVAVWLHLEIGGAWATNAFTDTAVTLAALAAAAGLTTVWHRTTGSTRWGWGLLASGAWLEALGEASWTIYEVGLGGVPYPGLPDVFYLGGYPLLAAGFIVLAWDQEDAVPGIQHVLDGLLVGIGLLTVSWVLVLEPLIAVSEVSAFELGVSLAYPVLDIVVGTAAFVLAMHARGARRAAMALVAAGIFTWAFGDSMFAYLEVTGGYSFALLDTAWVIGDLLIAMGALHPMAATIPSPAAGRRRYRVREMLAPYPPVLLALGVLGAHAAAGQFNTVEILLGASVLVFLVARQSVVLGDASRLSRDLDISEERFHQLAGNVDEVFWVVRPDMERFEYISPGFDRIHGRPAQERPETMDALLELVHPEDREEIIARLGETARLLEELEELDGADPANLDAAVTAPIRYRMVQPDGEERLVETQAAPVLDHQSKLRRIVGITRDVTSEAEAQRLREEAIERQADLDALRETEAFKARFLNMAAHELATPLTPLRFQLDALQEGVVGEATPAQLEALDVADRSAHRLELLVGNLIDATSLEAGELQLELAPRDLREIVDASVSTTRELGVPRIDLDAPTPAEAAIDPDRLERALVNLLLEAYDAQQGTDGDEPLQVTLAVQDGDAVVGIHAPGVQVDPETVETWFEPFEGLEEHAQAEAEGSGLGLYVAKGIFLAHGGTIEVEGAEDGAVFRVELPLAAEA